MKTLKTLALICLGALLFVGCDPVDGGDNDDTKGLILRADKYEIYDNGGTDANGIATFRLTFNGTPVTEGYTIYDENNNPIVGNTFSSTKIGYYEFWAEYGAAMTKVNIGITVVATPPAAPEAPTDSDPSNLNFNRRVMMIQFTGTGCGYCPGMVTALHQLAEDTSVNNNYVLAAAHIGGYAGSDPALITEMGSKNIDKAFGIANYPNLIVDMVPNTVDVYPTAAFLKSMVNTALNRVKVKGGIAVNTEYHADKKYVMVNALVKAKETADFRIGAWLLEDGIEGVQTVYADANTVAGINYNIHNNCIRSMKCIQPENDFDFSGLTLGNIKAGETASHEFAFSLKNAWKAENLHLIVFIATKEMSKDGKIKWYVNNAINAPINGSVEFEYAK